ncbi:hypothetical protein ABIA39_007143 [Nocardia sp. GAS34]|uniref:hypothetical protein n=1 Tax=unclassified Nocardia TaxID=2637762 RepID=UPI003D1B96FF
MLNAYWRLDPRPDGRPAPDGPLAEALEDKHELIAAGQAVAIGPPLDYAIGLHPSLTTIPLHGIEYTGSSSARSCSPLAPATAAAWSPRSANMPKLCSPEPSEL